MICSPCAQLSATNLSTNLIVFVLDSVFEEPADMCHEAVDIGEKVKRENLYVKHLI